MAPSVASTASKTPFVLVHGAWHGAWAFERVIPRLARLGHSAVARDLPGHGLNARFPSSYWRRPLDRAAFASEPSPLAAITLDAYVDAIIQTIEDVRSQGHDKVALLGHSMSGAPISAVAERVPQSISHLIYLTAYLPGPGVPVAAYAFSPENSGELSSAQMMADPAVVGVARIDGRSEDPAYLAKLRQAYYGDVSEDECRAVASLLTPDTPAAPFVTPVATTPERWGGLNRHYIMCLQDWAIRPTLQRRFVEEANAFVPGRPITLHQMDTSHSPFLSQPDALAELLAGIAAS